MSHGRECPQVRNCPMYALFRDAGTLKIWQMRFCSAEFKACERYKRSVQGRPVPLNLLPNGEVMRHVEHAPAPGTEAAPKPGSGP